MSLTEELIADLEELDNDEFEGSDDDEGSEGDEAQPMDFQLPNQEEDEELEKPDFEALQSKDITKIAKLYYSKNFQEILKVIFLILSFGFRIRVHSLIFLLHSFIFSFFCRKW